MENRSIYQLLFLYPLPSLMLIIVFEKVIYHGNVLARAVA